MNKNIYRWKILISDFFNKIPAIILIPAILFGSFLIAVLLIWSGTKVAVIDVKEPYETNSNTNTSKKKSITADNNYNLNDNYTNVGSKNNLEPGDSRNNGSELNSEPTAGSGDSNQQEGQQQDQTADTTSGGTSTSANSNSNSQSSSSSSSSEPEPARNSTSTSTSTSTSSGSSNRNYNSNISPNCTYPEGDPELWWRRSPKKQRDCYVKKHGFPDFLTKMPYFCDYDKNEDCSIAR